MGKDIGQDKGVLPGQEMGASAAADRVTDAPHQAPSGLGPDGSVPTSAQHTPGPWRYGYANNYEGFYIAPDVSLPTLAAVQTDGRVNVFNFPSQTEANARLIAAAPELLEALQAAVDDSTGKPNVWFFKAKDAIAKALGQ